MKACTVAAVQIAVEPNDVEANIAKGLQWLETAVNEYDADLVVFPESITTGFTPAISIEELTTRLDTIPGRTTAPIQDAAATHGVVIVWPTYEPAPDSERPGVYNSSVLIDADGSIAGVYRKSHPFPTERVGGGGWTLPGDRAEVYRTAVGKIGMMLCYDGDFPELARILAIKGAEIVVRPSALLRSFEIWSMTNHARAYDNHVYIVAANAVGPDAGGHYYFGHSMIVSPIAQQLALARGGEEIVAATLDPDPLKYVTYGSRKPMIFDHLEDRNIDCYDVLLQRARSAFEPARRIPYR